MHVLIRRYQQALLVGVGAIRQRADVRALS